MTQEETRLLENIVAISLKNKFGADFFYLKSQNLDIDFFIPQTATVIQVCFSLSAAGNAREIESIAHAAKLVKESKNFVIITYGEEKTLETDGIKIEVIPIWKWLL